MKKTLLLAAALLGFATASAGEIVGAEDNSTPWWSAWSKTTTLTGNGTIHFDLTNYSNGETNWNNWVLVLVDGDYNPANADTYASDHEFIVVRADKYGWGPLFEGSTLTADWEDWDAWKNNQNGAKVAIDLVREGETVTLTAVTTCADETVYNLGAVIPGINTETMGAFLTCEGAHLDIDKMEATTASVKNAMVDDNTAAEYYNLQGMRMHGNNLPAGIYVKRQGNKTVKMMVK